LLIHKELSLREPKDRSAHFESTAFRRALSSWFKRNGRKLPWRETSDPYRILVSELMLQQTQVVTVLDRYRRWFDRFPTIDALALAPESAVLHEWQGLGYYQRAINLHRCAQTIVEDFGGVFPRTIQQLSHLPGIGRYTAGAIMSFAFDRPAPIVDANVARVLSRLMNLNEPIDESDGKGKVWDAAARYVDGPRPGLLNSALMELGALVCAPRKPLCISCPVRTFCRAKHPESLPKKHPRPATERRVEKYLLVQKVDKILLQQNSGKRWRGLWSLPLEPAASEIRDDLAKPIVTLQHPITRFIIQLEVFQASPPRLLKQGQRWYALRELDDVPMPSPHRRAIRKALDFVATRQQNSAKGEH
jgi:A/G-specific adenine glycosylase